MTVSAPEAAQPDGLRRDCDQGSEAPSNLTDAPTRPRKRLIGFERFELAPAECRQITLIADRRLLARSDIEASQWRVAEGAHGIVVSRSAHRRSLDAEAELAGRLSGS